jgi:membrane-associated phospholipid phosphatase
MRCVVIHGYDTYGHSAMTDRARLRTWGTTGALSLLVIVVCVLVTRDGAVPSAERDVFRWINELPDVLETPMVAVQYLGVAVVPFIVAAVAAILRQWRLVIAALLVYPLKLLVEKAILKEIVQRPRPARTEPDAILRHAPADGLSFPSGHSIVAFALAGIISPYVSKGWRIVAFALATGVAFSRIYLGAHNPLDVVAGAAGGLLIAAVLNLVLFPKPASETRRPAATTTRGA